MHDNQLAPFVPGLPVTYRRAT